MKLVFKLLLLALLVAAMYLLIVKPELLIDPEKPNPAADGFSRFYSNFRNSLQQGDQKSEYVLNLRDTSKELVPLLYRREQQVSAAPANWRGEVKRRRFPAGDTLKNTLQAYAQQENMVLYWTLPRDYIVKQFFESRGTLVDTVQQIAITIGPDFVKPVHGYFCPKSRALVLTDSDDMFLKQHCIATGEAAQTRRIQ